MIPEKDRKRFLSKVKPQGECLIWTGRPNHFFFQSERGNSVIRRPRNVLFELVTGKKINNRKFFITCKNSNCIRPEHMRFGNENIEKDFWEKVEKENDCWVWTDKTMRFIRIGGKTSRPSRIAWEMLRGPIPKNYILTQVCGNKRCVRPDHLLCCTRSDFLKLFVPNIGAPKKPSTKMERLQKSKYKRLCESEIREVYEMRKAGKSQKEIADHLSVTEAAVSRWCRKLGFKKQDIKLTPRKMRTIQKHWQAGKTARWIAKRVNLSNCTIYFALKKLKAEGKISVE